MTNVEFLARCQKSSQGAFEAFKALLVELECQEKRPAALRFFHDLAAQLMKEHSADELTLRYHFSLSNLVLKPEDGGETRLLLLQLPSTFAPEEWSFTFFEGLTRYKVAEFQDRRIAELGCGNGWISIALAKQTKPLKIYGLDINPRAITCSRINLYLNAFDREGKPSWEHEGRTLTEVVEFHQSDLLAHCRTHHMVLDRIIGCIPQVLNPDPDFTARMLTGGITESASDEFLHSLSNYAPNQGHIEDQFGLGLIARAVEESVDVLRTSGKVILNLGGRPGTAVLERLFLRRGFTIRPVWHTRVNQAKDTDIQSLVTIEERTSHRFEFYMEHGSDIPISARTALAYAEAGGEIAHGLTVYEARLRDPLHIPKILRLLRQPGYEDARRAIDLSYAEDSLAVEKMSFLSAMVDQVQGDRFFPYEKTEGLRDFRRRLGYFFRNYHRINYEESHFVITPSAASTCRNILSLFRPKLALIDSTLAATVGARAGVLEIPRGADLLCELIERLKPELVIYSMPEVEARTRDSFLRILEVAASAKSRVFIDISDLLELSSTPASNGIFRYLVQNPLPPHVSLICGLVKNRLYPDLEVCFVISENQELIDHLISAAELTYSRTPVLSQLYYDRILQELLNFQITDGTHGRTGTQRARVAEDGFFKKNFIKLCPDAESAFRHPAVLGEKSAELPGAKIRLDYGENCLPAPEVLKRALFESFVKMDIAPEECDPANEAFELISKRFQFAEPKGLSLALSGGVAPLFAEIASHSAENGRTLIFPEGAYGYFAASARYHGAKTISVPTSAQEDFKVSPQGLDQALIRAGAGAWIVLSAPIVNPTGAIYTAPELDAIMSVGKKHGALLIMDSIFSGLEFSEGPEAHLPKLAGRWAVLGGLSKEFAAGGLRVGFGISSDAEISSAWRKANLTRPHPTLRFTLKKVLGLFLRKDPELRAELDLQRTELGSRAGRLSAVLNLSGWRTIDSKGGLFLIATPEGLVGKSLGSTRLTMENLAKQLRLKTGIIINTPEWIGIPGYFRFVISVSKNEFEQALLGLQEFFKELR